MVQKGSIQTSSKISTAISFKERVLLNYTAAYSVHKVFRKYICIKIIY
jgi:hypothetical protein